MKFLMHRLFMLLCLIKSFENGLALSLLELVWLTYWGWGEHCECIVVLKKVQCFDWWTWETKIHFLKIALYEHKLESRLPAEISITSDDTTFMAESEEELKSFLMKVKEEWKSWLKAQHSENEDHDIWSHHFMRNRWGNSGNSGNSVRLYFGGLQNHCRWWLQPWNQKMLTPWKKSYDQPR